MSAANQVDGLQGDNDYQYNGFAAGYDREIGSNWRIGLAGQYAKGDTSLTNATVKSKPRQALYMAHGLAIKVIM